MFAAGLFCGKIGWFYAFFAKIEKLSRVFFAIAPNLLAFFPTRW